MGGKLLQERADDLKNEENVGNFKQFVYQIKSFVTCAIRLGLSWVF